MLTCRKQRSYKAFRDTTVGARAPRPPSHFFKSVTTTTAEYCLAHESLLLSRINWRPRASIACRLRSLLADPASVTCASSWVYAKGKRIGMKLRPKRVIRNLSAVITVSLVLAACAVGGSNGSSGGSSSSGACGKYDSAILNNTRAWNFF
jgi:hypothetical protein